MADKAEVLAVDIGPPRLWELCLQSAVHHDYWRVQRRQLAYLPEDAANELLRRLLEQRRVSPPQLELFQRCATAVRLAGSSITGAWLAHLGTFSALHHLSLRRCTKLRDAHLQHLPALAPSLIELDVSGCTGLTDGAASHLLALTRLRALDLSSTSLGPAALPSLCSALTALTSLSLAELPADTRCCQAMGGHLACLRALDLSGTDVGSDGVRHLEHLPSLTHLDLSITQASSPPVVTSLRRLVMNACTLGLESGSAEEAAWLLLGAALPALEELQLVRASAGPPNGSALLRCLLAGAAGSLRRLDLGGCKFCGSLEPLAGASQLSHLDLTDTPVTDRHLADLALLPLTWASFAQTAVGDDGVAQLLAVTTLTRLDLRQTKVTDASWAVLAQLPSLSWLSLGETSTSFTAVPEGLSELSTLTYLDLLSTAVDNRGCRSLAAAAPHLQELRLGSPRVEDKGLRALCTLPQLELLHLMDCCVSDPGLLSALPRCATLRHLTLARCWPVSFAGVQAAATAAVQRGCQLVDVRFDEESFTLPPPAPQLSNTPGGRRPSPGGVAAKGTTMSPAGPAAGATSSGSVRMRAGAVLAPEVLAHDERLAYTLEELLSLASLSGAAAAQERQRLRQCLPPDLLLTSP